MNKDENYNLESVYASKIKAGKRRTYFFDVRETRGKDYYITMTESAKKFHGEGTERHKIFIYKEDFNRFLGALTDAINHVKTELLPDYDYAQYERRQEEWEKEQSDKPKDDTIQIQESSRTNSGKGDGYGDVSEEDVSW